MTWIEDDKMVLPVRNTDRQADTERRRATAGETDSQQTQLSSLFTQTDSVSLYIRHIIQDTTANRG